MGSHEREKVTFCITVFLNLISVDTAFSGFFSSTAKCPHGVSQILLGGKFHSRLNILAIII